MDLRRALQRLRKVSREVVMVIKFWSPEKTLFKERNNPPSPLLPRGQNEEA